MARMARSRSDRAPDARPSEHPQGAVYAAVLGAPGAGRRGRCRGRLPAELRRPDQTLRPWADDPRPRRQRPGAGFARPSFGQWLPYDHIPPEMRAAMISTEDRRFRSHIGVDPIGIGRAIGLGRRQGQPGQRDLDDHPAARAQHLPDQQPQLRPQAQGSDPRARARAEILEEPDPRALSQPRLFWRRRLWHRRRVAEVLRPWRRPSESRRSGDHRRAGQGAVQLFADRRRRGRARALGRRAADDGQERLHHRRTRPPRSIPPTSASSRPRTRTASATSPTGRCRSSTR